MLQGNRSYVLPVILAVILHIGLGYGLWVLQDKLTSLVKKNPPSIATRLVNEKLIPLPSTVQTKLIIEQPPKPKVITPPPRPQIKPQPRPKPRVQPKKAKKPSPKPQVKPKPEIQPKVQPADELDNLVKQLKKEPEKDAPPPKPLSPEMRVANRFVGQMQRQIENAWIQPPNVRYRDVAGLEVLIRLTLEPDGQLVNARVLSSSGNPQFDRSALNAVYKVRKFKVPPDADIFERFFRQVNINYSL